MIRPGNGVWSQRGFSLPNACGKVLSFCFLKRQEWDEVRLTLNGNKLTDKWKRFYTNWVICISSW